MLNEDLIEMALENNIQEGWVETTLGQSVNLIGGGTPKTTINEYWDGNIPWLSVVDFNDDNRWVSKTEKNITKLGLDKSSTKLLNKGDVIISARGTVGALAQLKHPMTFNQSCYGIREKENVTSENFMFYLIKYSIQKINRNVHGAVFDTITKQTFDFINILLPPLPEQKAIANILTAFDDKIELLQNQNKTLETMAQTIFKEWFGKYQIGDKLPEGWRVYRLGDITSKFATGLNPRKNFVLGRGNNFYVTIKNMGNNQIILNDKCDKITDEALLKINKRSNLQKGDFLFSGIGTIGRVYTLPMTPKNWNISESVFTIRADENSIKMGILYNLLLSKQFQHYCQQLASGSVQRGIRMADLKNYEIALPDIKMQGHINSILESNLLKTQSNNSQIQSLTKTRDTLLPKLMSGQVRVNNLKQTADA
jgi:type I restriction enzyme, S subunit